MTHRLYIQLGGYGDIMSLLPILYLDAQVGKRAGLMVAKDYAGILDGCSYVSPVIFDGHPWEIDRAVAQAKALTEDVVCCQVNGPPELVAQYSYGPKALSHATTESFQKEAWKIAGRLNDWRDQPPLVFDQRNPEREATLLNGSIKKKKLILVAAEGVSSPFPYKDLLFELLRLKFFRGYGIVDLSQFKAERLYDLLGLYDRAHCLVATDSAPLHLAHACKNLPVVALVNDRPLLWNGACWRANHICHIRYRDFPKRCVEMLTAIQSIGGMAGFASLRTESKMPKLIHVWSAYEVTADNSERHEAARGTWANEYDNGRWIACPVEIGAVGQDSQHSELADSKRFPFVHDVIRMACLRSRDGDLIVLTRCDTRWTTTVDLTGLLLNQSSPSWAHRQFEQPITHHPAVDLFAFTKSWWRDHQSEYPSRMVMGQDAYWHRILMELMKKHGGKELKGVVYRAHPKTAPASKTLPRYISHNDVLAKAWLDACGIKCSVPPVAEQLPTVAINPRAIHPYGYNPSIIRYDGRLLMAYRWHNEGTASTALAMAELDKDFNVIANKAIEVPQDSFGSHEDARLFILHGALHVSYVCSTWPANPPKSVVCYGRLEEGTTWRVLDAVQPEIGNNAGSAVEKNWVMFGHDDKLAILYHSQQSVFDVEKSPDDEPLRWPWGVIRGGTTPLPYKGNLLSFFHSRLDNEPAPWFWRYAVGARILEAKPPFRTLAVSKEPILRGSELDGLSDTERASCFHSKANVVFPGGAVECEGGWLVSVGCNDSSCMLVKIKESNLNL